MSGDKAAGPCNKFQPNIFNKSKCQNCFKSREVHLLNDRDMEQAKPIYAGWLCLAPVGTDFENPMQRSRKWQRRFFILYEHGSLSYALDELRSTLPQGTVNMNLCSDITDAEPRTGQKNALCIVTPAQEIFIRGDNKEVINGWTEQLAIYLQTNKQNQKKKRKVEPVANQEPSPAKMAATEQSCPSSEGSVTDSGQRQEEQRAGEPDVTPVWTVTGTDPLGSEWTPAGSTSSYLCPVSRASLISDAGHLGSLASSLDLAAGRNNNTNNENQLAGSTNIQTTADNQNQRQHRSHNSSADQLLGVEATRKEQQEEKDISRQGRTETRTTKQENLQSREHRAQLSAPLHQRRAKSLDRRTSDTIITPDLLNFKKGWMMKLDEHDQWKKYWFVLSADSLRYYKDSVAEETSDLEGEIDLTKCYCASEYQVQRNYGFQIHTRMGIFTLSAMTAGIRKNWIQALMKNVHPANAPDVASLPGHHIPCSPSEVVLKPDVTQDSASKDVPTEKDSQSLSTSLNKRQQESRSKTSDWSEFRTQNVDTEHQVDKPLSPLELSDLERRRRREERRKRYESMLGFSLGHGETHSVVDNSIRALSPKSQQRRKEEIEECWRKVEKKKIPERTILLCSEVRDTSEMEKLLHGYKKKVEELKEQLAESERSRLKMAAQISSAGLYQQQLDLPLSSEAVFCPAEMTEKQLRDLKDLHTESREVFLQQQAIGPQIREHFNHKPASSAPQIPSIWLHDTDDSLQELGDLLPETAATLPVTPPSNNSHEMSQVDGQVLGNNGTTTQHLNHLDREDCQLFPISEINMNNRDFLILETSAGRNDSTLNCVASDQLMIKRLSQEVEVLTRQGEALNQRNQEMLNQLTEADREIERLKMELSNKFTESHHISEMELKEKTLEDLERQLSLRNQELLEAQMLITSLKENLKETEEQLKSAAETEVLGEDGSKTHSETAEGCLLQCFEARETKLMQLEKQLEQSELTCRQLEQQNKELNEAGKCYLQKAAEMETDIERLNEELEKERLHEDKNKSFSGEEKIQQVIEGMVIRLKALEKLLDVTDSLDFVKETEIEQDSPDMVRQLRWEEEFWKLLLNKLKDNPSHLQEPDGMLLSEVTEGMMLEKQMLLEGHNLLPHTDELREDGKGMCESKVSQDMELILDSESVTASDATEVEDNCEISLNKQLCKIEHLKVFTHAKMILLNQLSSSISTSAHDKLLPTADRLHQFYFSQHPWSRSFIYSAATEALCCCLFSSLLSRYKCELCCDCVNIKEENKELKAKLSTLNEEQSHSLGAKVSTCCQTEEGSHQDADMELQSSGGSSTGDVQEEGTGNEMETPLIRDSNISEENVEEGEEEDLNMEMQQVSDLTAKVKELEEQLCISTDTMKEEFNEMMLSVQQQHEKEIEKLKATCERGLATMEECHLKLVEELQRLHQQEVERLLMERDSLLEEESAATVTAIEAIKNAHHVELQREIQRRHQTENYNGDTQLEEVHRQHREELASCQQELDVLSQQFSLKCLEIGHLVQALDAERKALCQCQQENQDLRSRNQELSGHLAAEITRLCSMAKQEALPLSQGMDVYEMEITLRVKESEVQCLKQEITSLKDELQVALKDKRNAAKMYKDMYVELNMVRTKAEQDGEELREKLRLAHQALNSTLP